VYIYIYEVWLNKPHLLSISGEGEFLVNLAMLALKSVLACFKQT